mmetsp:Transcript_3089/g.7559  ORF Transcript_3089/g.7559 Transcript_3089/m.7559 type:complete len:230 (+) Transcript_3089:874-1563(+)
MLVDADNQHRIILWVPTALSAPSRCPGQRSSFNPEVCHVTELANNFVDYLYLQQLVFGIDNLHWNAQKVEHGDLIFLRRHLGVARALCCGITFHGLRLRSLGCFHCCLVRLCCTQTPIQEKAVQVSHQFFVHVRGEDGVDLGCRLKDSAGIIKLLDCLNERLRFSIPKTSSRSTFPLHNAVCRILNRDPLRRLLIPTTVGFPLCLLSPSRLGFISRRCVDALGNLLFSV